jgi:hypothetical protein
MELFFSIFAQTKKKKKQMQEVNMHGNEKLTQP